MRTTKAAALCLALAALSLAGTACATGAATPSPLIAFEEQEVHWGACPDGYAHLTQAGGTCAELTVPLDHADPDGATITLALSRLEGAGDPADRGVLLSNPGGPGGPGLDLPLWLRETLGDAADGYDLIGFDPRFVGASTPLGCTPGEPREIPERTTPRADFDRSVSAAQDTARRCQEHGDNAALLPHGTTAAVARDMDLIRAALGRSELSFYGVSYGADLGAVYTQLFPDRAGRIVLDSSTDPAADQYTLLRDAGAPAEAALEPETARTLRDVLTHAEHTPLTVGGYRVDAGTLRLVVRQLVQNEEHDPVLAATARDLARAAAGESVEPGPELEMWLALLNSPDLDEIFAVPSFTMCADPGWPAGGFPREAEEYWRSIEERRATEPVFAPVAGAVSACAFWAEPRGERVAIGNDVELLMLQARGDVNTPHPGGVALHERLTGSRLLTAELRAHGVYGRGADGLTPVPCADEAVNAYFRDGTLPVADLSC